MYLPSDDIIEYHILDKCTTLLLAFQSFAASTPDPSHVMDDQGYPLSSNNMCSSYTYKTKTSLPIRRKVEEFQNILNKTMIEWIKETEACISIHATVYKRPT